MDWSGIVGNIGGAVLGGLFGRSSAESQMAHQKELMALQHKYNVEDYQHRYQWASQDMRAAGLNPVLAATNGIAGSINGVSSGVAAMAPTPDFAGAFSSAYQTASQKEIAKMQNEVAKEELKLKEKDINSAADKRAADTARENMMADVKKWAIQEENSRAWLKNSAEIENLKETIRIQEEHFLRSDAAAARSADAHMLAASASWRNSEVQSRLADLAEKTGYTQQELNKAHEIYLTALTGDVESMKEWHDYLNEHKEIRGAVGLIDSLWDTYSKGAKAHTMSNLFD